MPGPDVPMTNMEDLPSLFNCSNLITVSVMRPSDHAILRPPLPGCLRFSHFVATDKYPPRVTASRQPRADPLATSEAASVRPGTAAETHQSQHVL